MRIPPQNIESERALLGSILLRPASIHDIADFVFPEAFYVDKHRDIYSIMLELHQRREPIDTLSVQSRLNEKDLLDAIGGVAYLTDLTSAVPSSTNANHYAKIVSEKHSLRELIDAGDFISNLGFNEADDIESIMDKAEKRVFSATQTPGGHRFINIREVLPQSWETMEKLHASTGEMRGIPAGYQALDNKLSGFQRSDLIILAARPSTGKTAFALNIARNAAMKFGKRVAIFSLEMAAQQLVDRILAAEAQVDLWKMRTGAQLSEDDFDRIRDAMARLSEAPIYIDDQAGNSILKMRSTARRLKTQHGLDLIIVDYLQLITTPNKNYDSMVNQVTEISRSLKGLARELDVPLISLSQLSRAVEARGGKPRLSDLRDSGAIEQDADVVMFLHREKDEENGGRSQHTEVLVEKHRNGPTGHVSLFFDVDKQVFLDMATSDFGDYGIADEGEQF